MKKNLIFSLILIVTLNISSFAGKVEEQLRSKGLHVADLTAEDEINLQVNKLQQSIQLQSIDDIKMILSPNYVETDQSVSQSAIQEKLEKCFARFLQVREVNTQINSETGWKVTATQDFYIQNIKINVKQDKAIAECEIGFYSAGEEYQKLSETLSFVFVENTWLLSASKNLFGFLEQASKATKAELGTPNWVSGVMRGTKDDLASTSMLVPEILFYHNGDPVPRFNLSTSYQYFSYYDQNHHRWNWINIMNYPYGILADVLVTPGGNDPLNHDFLFVSDVTCNKIVATQMDSWIAEYGTYSGDEQFNGPHGMSNLGDLYFVTDMANNRVVAYQFENGWDSPLYSFTISNGFHQPRDVAAKECRISEPQEDMTRVVVADTRMHRLAFYLWPDYYPICFDRFYGEYGSGIGEFIEPTSVCFGRNPTHTWQTDDVFVTDNGNHRLVWLYITTPVGSVNWKGTYVFPAGVELTSVEVDNNNLVYVLDRRHGKVYKFTPSEDHFTLLGIWGGTGIADGQLNYPNMLEVAHGRVCPPPCEPLSLGDIFVTESWGEQTGIRRFVIGSDVLNLTSGWVPYNQSTGEGNYIWWNYNLTDFATVTDTVKHNAVVCTTYSRGTINYGSQSGNWPVDGHQHGTNYTVKISATSIYDPTVVVEKSIDVYVDTMSIHNPVITQGIRVKYDSDPVGCIDSCECIREYGLYTLYVQAYDPDGGPLSYMWNAGKGQFFYDGYMWDSLSTTENYVCYWALNSDAQHKDNIPEWIEVRVSNVNGGHVHSVVNPYILPETTSCICGDANGSGAIEVGDIVVLIHYLYNTGPPPTVPIERGDVNNNCVIEVGDITALINYLYKGYPRSSIRCCWIH